MKTIRAATTICAVSKIAGLFLLLDVRTGRLACRDPGFKNNGSPGIVVSLRRTLGLMIS
jgi:hypothetical protein